MRFLQSLLGEMPREDGRLTAADMRRAFQNLPALEGEQVRLRLPSLSDAGDLFAYARDEEMSRFVLWDTHRSLGDSREVLRGIVRRNRRGLPVTLAIALKSDDRMIGTIGFQWIDAECRSCEVGYSIARRLWNHGIATDALRAILPLAFDTLGLNRVEARHDVQNPASGRVMEKAGFHLEGVARESLMLKGRLADMASYAIFKEDWRRQTLQRKSREAQAIKSIAQAETDEIQQGMRKEDVV